MLQKMYSENIREAQNHASYNDTSEKVKPKKLDFLFYWRALTKKRWPVALFTALVTAIAIYYTQIVVPIYAANATLLLESQKANIISIEDLVSSDQESLDYYGTQYAILRSRAVAERVIRQLKLRENITQEQFAELLTPSQGQQILDGLSRTLGLGENPSTTDSDDESTSLAGEKDGFANRQDSPEFNEILQQFRQSLRISPVVKTKLVTIVYESPDPEFSALVANAVAQQYIESVLERRKAFKDEASIWMDGRIAELKTKLDESEESLIAFKKANGLVDLNGDVSRLNEQELLLTSSTLAEANRELSNARDLYLKIQNFKESAPQQIRTLPFVQNDPLVRSVETEIGQAQRDINRLRNRFGVKHPVIIDAVSRLASLRSTLDGHVQRTVSTFENNYQLLQQRVASLEADVVQGKDNIQAIGQQKITLEALEREVTANRDQYNRLFDRITETRTTDGLDEANAVVAEAAWVPSKPVAPNKKLIIGLAIFGSLMLAAIVCFIIEYLDNTVTSVEDIERRLKTKLLGVLPYIKQGFLRSNKDVPLTASNIADKSVSFSEAVNTCRTALTISNDSDFQVLLITSSVPDEGKSTVALNLAHSFGQMERTLLIDCDLRRPSIAKALGMPEIAVGLSSILMKKFKLVDCIKRDDSNSFDVLASGPIPDQPLELLASRTFIKSLEALRQHYDKIIIDSAPIHVVSDALVLSKLADSVLYVVRPHKTPMKIIDSGLTRLAEAGATLTGVCISQVDIDKTKSYGGLEFHGFGIDNDKYGSYYYGGRRKKRPKLKLKRAS